MEIQQHDGVVVEVAGFQQGFAKHCGRREMCHGREREAQGLGFAALPSPHYNRAKGEGGAALALPPRKGAARRSPSSPRHLGGAFPLEDSSLFPISWRMGL